MAPYAIRRLELADANHVAHVLRASFDDRLPWLSGLHTAEEDRQFVREHLFGQCEIWGALSPDLVGFVAFCPGWVDQLYVLPGRQGEGIGSALLSIAKDAEAELRLWTFQRNVQARQFYEARGFVAIDQTDGRDNEEREPDVLYRWARGAGP
ncbi:MAG: GNAT family N-acetyltransferase [Rhizobium sp.]|nr:GNAT family N-acetyltransferase [Rhizobium sp.]